MIFLNDVLNRRSKKVKVLNVSIIVMPIEHNSGGFFTAQQKSNREQFEHSV